jgi:ferredoxin
MVSDDRGTSFGSGCLGCPDEPCIRLAADELARSARIDSPYSPEPSVCPTDAIARHADGLARIEPGRCIGCGLCVVRCPVGAIWIDESTTTARVEPPTASAYEQVELPLTEFVDRREEVSDVLTLELPPFDYRAVIAQVEKAAPTIESADGQRVLRLLARNTFLLSSAAARLKIVEDNNAACELIVDGSGPLLVVEVEPSGDVLDAMRRALAGCAIVISRYGVDRQGVRAALVVKRLPNERVDYYRVVGDVASRLGVETYTVPLAVILLAIRAGGVDLANRLDEFGVGDMSAVHAIALQFGPVNDPARAGLMPPK